MTSTYTYQKLSFNGYEAYFLMVSTHGLFSRVKTRFVPTLSNFIADKKNNMTKLGRFPEKINEKNFFHFIHAEDSSRLDEFTRTYPDIRLYITELNHYFRSVEDENKYMLYADLVIP
jgi:hypothetical protein